MMWEAGRKTGHTFSQPDLIIAATAARMDSQLLAGIKFITNGQWSGFESVD